MYVNSPHLSTNGTLSVTSVLEARAGDEYFPSIADALSASTILNASTAKLSGHTVRSGMMNGIVGYKQYSDTTYSCSYRSYRSSGRVQTVYSYGTGFSAINNQIALGFQGFFDNGYDEYTGYLNPGGSSLAWQAVLNRAVMSNMYNQAITECRIKAQSMKIDVSESLSGVKRTVLMVAERTSQVLNAWNAARKGDVRGVIKHLNLNRSWRNLPRTVSGLWLELQYGWLPLLNDIAAGIAVVNDRLNPVPNPKQFVVVRRLNRGLILPDPSKSAEFIWEDAEKSSHAESSIEVKYRFRVRDDFWAYLNSLNVLNPAYLAWVSLPFSFVVDWLLPVASWLQALTATIGLEFTSGYSTLRSWGGSTVKASLRNTGAYQRVLTIGSSQASVEVGYMGRIAYSSFPFPLPYFKFPFSSDRRVASAIALSVQTGKHR